VTHAAALYRVGHTDHTYATVTDFLVETQAVAAPMILLVLTLVVAGARFGPYAL
jgi:hypothetical protein